MKEQKRTGLVGKIEKIADEISVISGAVGAVSACACVIPRLMYGDASPVIPYENSVIFPTLISSMEFMIPSFVTSVLCHAIGSLNKKKEMGYYL